MIQLSYSTGRETTTPTLADALEEIRIDILFGLKAEEDVNRCRTQHGAHLGR